MKVVGISIIAAATLALASTATAAYPVPVTKGQWIAAKNAWTRAATAHGVQQADIRCAYPRHQTPYCEFGQQFGSVQLHGTTARCELVAWSVKPPGSRGFKVSRVTVTPCKAGWTRTLPVPW